MRFACVLGALAFVVGMDLIVFSPVPVAHECRFEPLIAALDGMPPGLFGYHPRATERYYYRTWPPGVAVAAAGVASICVGVYLRRQRRRWARSRLGVAGEWVEVALGADLVREDLVREVGGEVGGAAIATAAELPAAGCWARARSRLAVAGVDRVEIALGADLVRSSWRPSRRPRLLAAGPGCAWRSPASIGPRSRSASSGSRSRLDVVRRTRR